MANLHLGPQQIGGIYYCGYWGYVYQVLDIKGSEITCKLINNERVFPNIRNSSNFQVGRVWSHMTSWDPAHDKVVSQPHQVS